MWLAARSNPSPNVCQMSPEAIASRSARCSEVRVVCTGVGSIGPLTVCCSGRHRIPPDAASSSSVKKPAWPLRIDIRSTPSIVQS
nr:hypothetical protein CPGR_06083 [Mycolicibacter nonchromogenicus]